MVKRLTMLMGGLFFQQEQPSLKLLLQVVSQEDGEPVIGASIKIEGTKTGTVTDVDGNFSLVAPSGNAKLVISYLGMKSQKVVAKSKMKIVLEGEDNTLNDVVVTA